MISNIHSGGGGGNGALQSVHQNGKNANNFSQIADKLFAKIDANSDGIVDKSELSTVLASMSTDKANMPTAEELFAKLDADGDGEITKEEHDQGLKSLMQEYGSQMRRLHRPDPDKLFAKADADGNTSVDKSELTSFLEHGPGGAGKAPSVDALFAKLDGDGDGSISKDENKAGLEARHQENNQSVSGNAFAAFVSVILEQYRTNSNDTLKTDSGASFSVAA